MEQMPPGWFSLWKEEHDKKIDRILSHVEDQTTINREVEGRLAVVEAAPAARATVISAAITAAGVFLAAIIAWLRGGQ